MLKPCPWWGQGQAKPSRPNNSVGQADQKSREQTAKSPPRGGQVVGGQEASALLHPPPSVGPGLCACNSLLLCFYGGAAIALESRVPHAMCATPLDLHKGEGWVF